MSYTSLSKKDRQEMLARIGVSSIDELFCCIPEAIHLKTDLDLPGPFSEMELAARIQAIGDKNVTAGTLSFLGGGAYAHFIPSVVDYLSSRGEFVSPYTPYQPEVSQGTLQVIYEFQTLICQLAGLDIANASLYEGATAAAEAVLMAQRVTGKSKVLVAASLHPQYREVIRTYIRNLDLAVEEIPFSDRGALDAAALDKALDDGTAAVLFQSPNYFGVCEDVRAISGAAKAKGALSVAMVAEALSLALLEAPGKLGADIVAGEAQSFGIPLSFGGPYLGFMAARKEYLRQLPGRICGQTTDVEGRTGYVLTLSTREQHIRRERATSNICTNQALCALRATIYLAAMGREGLRRAAEQNAAKAAYALEKLIAVPGVERRFSGPIFNEFVLRLPKSWSCVDAALRTKGLRGGIGLEADYHDCERCVLVCITELHAREDIDRLAAGLEEVLR